MYFRCAVVVLWLCSSYRVALASELSHSQIVTIAVQQTPQSFNPFSSKNVMPPQFKHLFFDPLFRWNNQQQIEPRLIKDWQRIDAQTVRFNLRENIQFHSGNDLHSADVIWSFKQAKKQPKIAKLFVKIEVLKAINDTSFYIKSSYTDKQLLDYLTHLFVLDSIFYKANMALLEKPATIVTVPIKERPLSGSGPYIINQYNASLGLEVSVNKAYWDTRVEMESLHFMHIHSEQSRLFALLTDDVQVSDSIPNKKIDDILENSSKQLIQVASTDVVFLTMNDKANAQLSDKRIRETIQLAINQRGMLKHILNDCGRINVLFNALVEQPDALENELPRYDLIAAKDRLKEIKLPSQMSLLVMLDEQGINTQIAAALTHMLNEIGIKVITKKTSSLEIWDNTNLYYDLTVVSWKTRQMSRSNIYEELFSTSLLAKYLQDHFKHQNINDDLLLQLKAFEMMQKDNWVLPLFFQNEIWAAHGQLNLSNVFSSNGIPYWSLLEIEK